jgi:hypothetical protein
MKETTSAVERVTELGYRLLMAAQASDKTTYIQIDKRGTVIVHMGGAGR